MQKQCKYSITSTIFLWFSISTAIHAEISSQALLDLATCYGVNLPPKAFQSSANKDPRILRMEQTLASFKEKKGIKLSEVNGFYEPTTKKQVLGFPLHFIGLNGFGPFKGISLSVGGEFNTVKQALEKQQGIQYDHCKSNSKLHLETCHQNLSKQYGHVVMTHPSNPRAQVVLICVDKENNS